MKDTSSKKRKLNDGSPLIVENKEVRTQKEKADYNERKYESKQEAYQEENENNMKNINFELFDEIKKDLIVLLNKSIDISKKAIISTKLFNKVKGVAVQISNSKTGGRLIQMLLKYLPLDLKENLIAIILSSNVIEMTKSKYAHHVLITMIRQSSRRVRDQLLTLFLKHAHQLISHQYSSCVIQTFLSRNNNNILNAFKSQIRVDSKKNEIVENMAIKMLDKNIIKYQMTQYVVSKAIPTAIPVEQEKMIQYCINNVKEILQYKDGLNLFALVVNYSNSKQRKQILKYFKHNVKQIVEETNFGYSAIEKLLHSLDDTKATAGAFLIPLKKDFKENIENKNWFSIINNIFTQKPGRFQFEEPENGFTTSKKDENTRLHELRQSVIDNLAQYVDEQPFEAVYYDPNFIHLAIATIRFVIEHNLDYHEYLIQNAQKVDITHPIGNRVAKTLVVSSASSDYFSNTLNNYITALIQKFKNDLTLLNTKACFVALGILEFTPFKEQLSNIIRPKLELVTDEKNLELLQKHL